MGKIMRIKNGTMYKKIIIIYTSILVIVILILDAFFAGKVLNNIRESQLYINDKVIYDINEELININNAVTIATTNMYRDNDIITDIIDFLNFDNISYLKNKLDNYAMSNDSIYKGVEYFVEGCINLNPNLEKIEFVSYSRNEVTSFNRDKKTRYEKITKESIEERYKYKNTLKDKNYIYNIREINNPLTYKNEGEIVFVFNLDFISKILEKYDNKYETLILNKNGFCIYDSTGKYTNSHYPYNDGLIIGKNQFYLEENYSINSIYNNLDLITIGRIKKTNTMKLPISFHISVFFIDVIVFVIAEIFFYFKIKNISDRMNKLLLAMDKVKQGDVNVVIPVGKEVDEINIISENFNEMCTQLNDYIEKSYVYELNEKKAEVNQKKAELMALQSQINPHFLYNTLESIRMKAICNGDKEVGKMLYILAFLFRSQLKDKDIISIKNEIEYCEKYLEMFKFRYEDKFEFNINCPKEILDNQIIKFTIQPLIENYFVHGIRLEDDDNKLTISIEEVNDKVLIYIEDNGRGIEDEKLLQMNRMLTDKYGTGQSIGITNANERIRILYGKEYGIKIEKAVEKGLKVIVTIPSRKVD